MPTLASLTANNTSAASSWSDTSTGDAIPGNVSKVSIKKPLYGLNGVGVTTKAYVHHVSWFRPGHHISVGYDSTSQTQINKQIADEQSNGIDGCILDWYGKPTLTSDSGISDGVAHKFISQAHLLGNYEFAICIDHACVDPAKVGGTATANFIAQLQYINSTYYANSAYMKHAGRPILFEFGMENVAGIDWTAVRAAMVSNGNPYFIFENTAGFTNGHSDGAFAWIGSLPPPGGDPENLNYLNNFYASALAHPSALAFGSLRKGFNDDLTNGISGDGIGDWGNGAVRSMTQANGQTWVDSFGAINGNYSAGNQLYAIQLVTWDDYEEGSELETGIDTNLAFTSVTYSAGVLNWTVTGYENAFDHYDVYISSDGVNVTWLASVPKGTYTYNLLASNPTLPGGNYSVYVQAVGIARIKNLLAGTVVSIAIAGSKEITYPDPPLQSSVFDSETRYLGRNWRLWLLLFKARIKLRLCDSTGGAYNEQLPLAAKNQAVIIVLAKKSSDANHITPTASTGDVLTKNTQLAAQWDVGAYMSDGVKTWIRII